MRNIAKKVMNRVTKYLIKLYIPINRLYCSVHGVKVGRKFQVKGLLYIKNNGSIQIGDGVRINSAAWANPIGCGDRTYIQIFSGGKLAVGNKCGISNCAITAAKEIVIEENVLIGAGCKIYDTDFHSISFADRINGLNQNVRCKPIRIKKGAFIGANTIILKGVTIGENAVLGAGSVVTKNVPDNEIWAGNPAKRIGTI